MRSLLALTLVSGTAALLLAEPAWWVQRGVRDPAKAPSDYAVLNQGQLKNLARAARDEMEAKLPGGAGAAINALVNSWITPTATTSDFAVVNAGQLKSVAKLFYDRLIAEGQLVEIPWSEENQDDRDFSAVNLGQAKRLFAFEVSVDTDSDGLADDWEIQHFGGLQRDGALDADGDGLSDLAEYLAGLNPAVWDTNGNLLSDADEAGPGTASTAHLVVYTPMMTR